MTTLLALVLSYLLGAIPVAYLVARLNQVNIFEVGSGNMGTTNVLRAVGPVMGVLVLLLDVLKSALAVYVARVIVPESYNTITLLAAIVAIAGHNWSVFAWMVTGKLRGGKGAASAMGTAIMILPVWVIVACVVMFVSIVAKTRLMSLGVLVTVAIGSMMAFTSMFLQQTPMIFAVYILALDGLIFYRFRSNIQRLREGNERRVGDRA
ncbi:MAG: glycerol-3-phosphate acyltransferase [Phototrophicaceae bacterium]